MACQGFDEQLVRHHPQVKDLMEQFVGVRIIKANGLDLSLFQFDFDLTFAAFFLNVDGTLYGRFGTRSDNKEAARDISLAGFRQALLGALELHASYPTNQTMLTAKRGGPPPFKSPEEYPSLKDKYPSALDFAGSNFMKSCVHCHQIRDADRLVYRSRNEPLPDDMLFPWPMPDVLGFSLDPQEKARVTKILPGSVADNAGLKPGDEILFMEGQPLISIADVQWVLHRAATPGQAKMTVRRDGREQSLVLALAAGWRRKVDISWRPTSWDLRRMATGGLLLKELPAAERSALSLREDQLALRVEHVGEYGEHATAKKAGFLKQDVIIAWDGRRERLTESDIFADGMQKKTPGSTVAVTVRRGESEVEMQLPMK